MTSHGTKIQHGALIVGLLNALMLPKRLAIIKCSAHKKVTYHISQGNAFADEIAKKTAKEEYSLMFVAGSARWMPENGMFGATLDSVREIQQEVTKTELEVWRKYGRKDETGCWVELSDKQKWMLPNAFVHAIVTMAHGPAHISAKGIISTIDNVWWNPLISKAAIALVKACMICSMYNAGKGIPTPKGQFGPPSQPFECLQMDFIEMECCNTVSYTHLTLPTSLRV